MGSPACSYLCGGFGGYCDLGGVIGLRSTRMLPGNAEVPQEGIQFPLINFVHPVHDG